MPLSEEEQRLLEQMEQALADEDPKFASALRGSTLRARLRRTVIVSALCFVAGVAVLMFGVVLKLTPVSVVGFCLMLAGAYFFATAWRRGGEIASEQPAEPSGSQPRAVARSPRQSSFMDRMEERWRRRRDEGS
ncbi:MAG: DUF3040 domain-containing protein [Actinomycetota bacterium]|nr:DUF3040 domain-containing protein [Nocardioidaceae bacterium]MDQ3592938.1 DUF3040 domain-containing protein [Actinomycetota bacterium]